MKDPETAKKIRAAVPSNPRGPARVAPRPPILDATHWEAALAAIERHIPEREAILWLRPMRFEAGSPGHLRLSAPNRYIEGWFRENYLPALCRELRILTGADVSVSVEVVEAPVDPTPDAAAAPDPPAPARRVQAGPDRFADTDLNPRYRFDTFVSAPSNQLAHAASQAVAATPASKYNPLFIYGGVGLGKTHLLCAIGHELRERHGLRVAYLSTERFLNEYIDHVRTGRMEDFRAKYRRGCDALLMDDIQFIAGKDRTQDEFFHTFNALHDTGRQIVLTSDRYPHEMPELEERLRTRFQWGLIADIQPPGMETRAAILKKKAELDGIPLDDDVAMFLAKHSRTNVRELEGSLIRLAADASLRGVPITVDFARESLRSLLGPDTRKLTCERIQKVVAEHFNLKVSDLRGKRRHQAVARPRQVAMFLCRELLDLSFPAIGQRFGGKDHTTVMAACRRITTLITHDLTLRSDVEHLRRLLQA